MLPPFVLFAVSFLPQAQISTDLTLPPETARLDAIYEGRGVQLYQCTVSPAGVYRWIFTAPEAQLFNLATGQAAGHHDAGPSWTLDDGTVLHGSVLQSRVSGAPGDIPWLLLRVQSTKSLPAGAAARPDSPHQAGHDTPVAPYTYVRRYNTRGGVAPVTGCDATHANAVVRVPYQASYAFFR